MLKHKNILAVLGLIVLSSVFSFGAIVKANPSYFIRSGSTATTTLTYATAGTATTTIVFDLGQKTNKGADDISFLEQFTGSSTASVLNTEFQYSDDGIDWYATSLGWAVDTNGSSATTSPSIGNIEKFTFTYASSTINELATDKTIPSSNRILHLEAPSRYIRAILTLPAGSTNGAFWGEFIAKVQSN